MSRLQQYVEIVNGRVVRSGSVPADEFAAQQPILGGELKPVDRIPETAENYALAWNAAQSRVVLTWAGKVEPAAVRVVARAALRKAVAETGRLAEFDQIAADGDTALRIAWQDVTEFRRNHADVERWRAAFGLASADVAQLFARAGEIEKAGE